MRGFLGRFARNFYGSLIGLLAVFLGGAFFGLVDPFLVLFRQPREKSVGINVSIGIRKCLSTGSENLPNETGDISARQNWSADCALVFLHKCGARQGPPNLPFHTVVIAYVHVAPGTTMKHWIRNGRLPPVQAVPPL